MTDNIWKLRVLWMLVRVTFDDWKRDIWRNDPDAQYCCDGRECGCGAATWREIYPLRSQP